MQDTRLTRLGARALGKTEPNPTERMAVIKKSLSIEFPRALEAILLALRGAIVFDKGAIFTSDERSPVDDSHGKQGLGVLYGIEDDRNGLLACNEMYADQLPRNLITIGETPGGNQVCLERGSGRILFWHHEALTDDSALFQIALTFDDFIARLEPQESNGPVAPPKGVIPSKTWFDF